MRNTVLLDFPTPYQDEFFGGLLLRYHEERGTGTLRHMLYRKLKISSGCLTGIPTALAEFIGKIPLAWRGGIDSIAENHTAWPIYRPFLTDFSASRAWKRIASGPKGSMQLTLGDSSSRLLIEKFIQICPQCAADDLQNVGRPYVHVDHQLPGIRSCSKHGLVLQQIRNIFTPPYNPFCDVLNGADKPFQPATPAEIKFATLAAALRAGHLPRLDHRILFNVYFDRLQCMDLATHGGRIRYGSLLSMIEQTFSRELLERFGGSRLTLYHWVHAILFKPNASHHPIKHLLLIGTLFGSVRAFEEAIGQFELRFDSKAGPIAKRDIAGEVKDQYAQGESSATRAAKRIGVCTTTYVTYAKRLGLPVRVRPKRLTVKLIAKIERLAKYGRSIADISVAASVSAPTIYRVIRASRPTDVARRRVKEISARKRHRKIWTGRLKTAGKAGVGELRRQAPATYAWLYRHDPGWLKMHPPRSREIPIVCMKP